MDYQLIKNIIESYKSKFEDINKKEIYKWQAVKCFQDNWNIQAKDFVKMLEKSLAQTFNLLDSGHYFPRKMILLLAKKAPSDVKKMFIGLIDEENDLKRRVEEFQKEIKKLNKATFPGTNDFQDIRAVMIYLALLYPERYFIFKFRLFKDFATLIGHQFVPVMGKFENVLQYNSLCERIKAEIKKDNQLLKMHNERISEKEYFDSSSNILTQDVIWDATHNCGKKMIVNEQLPASRRLIKVNIPLFPIKHEVILRGSSTNYIENARERKNVGDGGEDLVMQYEAEKLANLGIRKKPEHIARSKGDGLGYDILSYDEDGNPMFIEVKTTKSGSKTSFYVTINELTCSMENKENYYLYRLFDYEPKKDKAKMKVARGSLEDKCIYPTLFIVVL
jgi:hypothetical protein